MPSLFKKCYWIVYSSHCFKHSNFMTKKSEKILAFSFNNLQLLLTITSIVTVNKRKKWYYTKLQFISLIRMHLNFLFRGGKEEIFVYVIKPHIANIFRNLRIEKFNTYLVFGILPDILCAHIFSHNSDSIVLMLRLFQLFPNESKP